MPRLVALQMDPPQQLNPLGDSTFALMEEAERRGMEMVSFQPQHLSYRQNELFAHVCPLGLKGGLTQGETKTISLAQCDTVLMRQDPPFDMNYISATYLLEALTPETPVVNSPSFVRNNPEKLLPLAFPDCIPPTLISSEPEALRSFHREHKKIVLKPLYGFAGNGVFFIDEQGSNFEALIELLQKTREPMVAQAFLPEVKKAEMRVLLIGGKISGAFIRIPQEGEIRSNLRVGGTAQKVELNAKQQKICEEVAAFLHQNGVLLAGVDLIGDYLIEVNITSPTGLRQVRQLYGTSPEADFWDTVEALG